MADTPQRPEDMSFSYAPNLDTIPEEPDNLWGAEAEGVDGQQSHGVFWLVIMVFLMVLAASLGYILYRRYFEKKGLAVVQQGSAPPADVQEAEPDCARPSTAEAVERESVPPPPEKPRSLYRPSLTTSSDSIRRVFMTNKGLREYPVNEYGVPCLVSSTA